MTTMSTTLTTNSRLAARLTVVLILLLSLVSCHAQRTVAALGTKLKTPNKSQPVDEPVVEVDIQTLKEDEDVAVEEKLHPHKPMDIAFEGIRMELQQKKNGSRVLLDGSIRGRARPGRMLAIMGPSGSGKSSLLHALAGKIKHNSKLSLSGMRYLNGVAIEGDSRLPVAMIEQEVDFFPHMTVKETLDFRVELKLGRRFSRSQRDKLVAELMEELNLSQVAHTSVGNSKIRGISGGERKRLSIACEMISSPSVVFLDEPTSGLDSYQALQVVETLRELANDGKTIVAVIHQPNQHVFSLFDDLLLLSEGKQMYFGEVSQVRSYMEKIGYVAPKEMGTAEHVLECISRVNGGGAEEAASAGRIMVISEKARTVEIDLGIKEGKQLRRYASELNGGGPRAGLLRQFRLLLSRSFREQLRGKGAIIIKLVQQVSLGIIYGGIYGLGTNQASIQDRVGLLSLIAIGAANMAMAGTIRSFPKEKAIVANEMGAKLYKTFPYFVAKAISEIPLIGAFNSVFCSIVYSLTGLQKTFEKFRMFLFLTSLHSIASEAAGLLVGSISSTSDVALALFPPIIVLNIIFDGKNISEENTPRLLRWIPKVGLIRWGFEGLALNEFEGLTFDTSGPRRGPVAKTGEEALDRFGLYGKTVGNVIQAQSSIIAACWFMSYLGLSLTRQRYLVMRPPEKISKEKRS